MRNFYYSIPRLTQWLQLNFLLSLFFLVLLYIHWHVWETSNAWQPLVISIGINGKWASRKVSHSSISDLWKYSIEAFSARTHTSVNCSWQQKERKKNRKSKSNIKSIRDCDRMVGCAVTMKTLLITTRKCKQHFKLSRTETDTDTHTPSHLHMNQSLIDE